MEILIFGIILVALMAWASTRIKKNAAAAFDAESVSTPAFTIEKPAGMLHVLNGNPELEFEAYSKEFGTGVMSKMRMFRAEVKKLHPTGIAAKIAEIKKSGQVRDDRKEVIDGRTYHVIEIEEGGTKVPCRVKYKIAETQDAAYVLKLRALEEAGENVFETLDVMLESFVLKDAEAAV
ncbi:MAG: hypothetical protein UZ17_ACD001001011 [Acidobacteria bacterium OLB17]|nr:MAG: hypothetical protein UZ17_ACD001001011 [Acidobacteria bacterium OLB17]MCZ2391061.1 ParB/RepB/Spo0J family partition protein [Acidobacteriota bacterium]